MKRLKENMKRFGTKNLSEQGTSGDSGYFTSSDRMKTRKKVNADQLKKALPEGTTATIMTAPEGFLLIVDEQNNYYELI